MTRRFPIILGISLLALAGCVAAPAGPAAPAPAQVAATVAATAAPDVAPPSTALPAEPAAAATETPPAAPAAPAPASTAEVTPPQLTARLLTTFAAPQPSRFFALSPDGALLAYATAETEDADGGDIVIADAATGAEVRRIPAAEANGARALGLAFSADGAQLAAVHADGIVRIWDVAAGAEAALVDFGPIFEGYTYRFHAALSPDRGRILLSALGSSFDGPIRLQLWDVASGTQVWQVAKEDSMYDAGWSADGQRVFSLTYLTKPFRDNVSEGYGAVEVYDAATGELLSTFTARGADRAALSAGAERLIAADGYETQVVDLATGRDLFRVVGGDVALAPAAGRFVTRDARNRIRLWDAASGEYLAEVGSADSHLFSGRCIYCLAISPDGRRIAAWDGKRGIRVWEAPGEAQPRPAVTAAAPIKTLTLADHPTQRTQLVSFPATLSRDGRRAVWNDNGEVMVWDAATGQRTYSGVFFPKKKYLDSDGVEMKVVDTSFVSAPVDPDATAMVFMSPERRWDAPRVWRVDAPEPQWVFPAGEAPLQGFGAPLNWAWSADGSRVAAPEQSSSGSGGMGVAVWEPASGKVVRLQPSLPANFAFQQLVLDAAGERVVLAGRDGLLAYDVAGGRQLWATALPLLGFETYRIRLGALSFSPDGRRLVVAAEDLTVRVLDAATGVELAHGTGLSLAPTRIAWRGDSRYFVTGSDDVTAVIWDAATAQPVRRLPGHDEAVSGVAFTADEQQVVTLTTAFTVQTWDVAELE